MALGLQVSIPSLFPGFSLQLALGRSNPLFKLSPPSQNDQCPPFALGIAVAVDSYLSPQLRNMYLFSAASNI